MTDFTNDPRFDGLYMNVANTARGIEPLLDTVFSFLRRKTDFFSGPTGSDNGTELAIQKVNEVLQKHAELYKAEQAAKQQPKKTKSPATTKSAAPKKKKEKQEEGIIEMGTDGGFDISSSATAAATAAAAAASTTKSTAATATATATATAKDTNTDTNTTSSKPATTTNNEKKTNDTKQEEIKKSIDSTSDTKKEAPPLGNGGTVDGKYVWTQTLSELSVTIPVPDNTRGKDLNVTIARSHLKVGLRSSSSSSQKGEWIINAPLTKKVICDDSFWTVEDGNKLVISLQKVNQMEWWDGVVEGDAKIDVKKIQPENSSLGDLDGETRKTVEKMMFDQRQKAMGLPSSDEQVKLDALERFKKQHPEMDFSNAKIT